MAGLKKIRPSYVILVISLLVIITNFIFGGTVLRSQEVNEKRLEDRAEELRSAISERGSGPQQEVQAANFIKGLTESADLTSILDEIFKSATKSGLDVPSADYNPEAFKDSSMSRYAFTFPVEGRYRDIKKFLYDLESSRRPLVIEELSLASGKTNEGKIRLRIRMSVYYR